MALLMWIPKVLVVRHPARRTQLVAVRVKEEVGARTPPSHEGQANKMALSILGFFRGIK